MTSLFAAAVLAPFTYGFSAGSAFSYELDATFTGLIPILGGQEGTARVLLDIDVAGLKSKEATENAASSEITEAKIYFNDALLPLDKGSVTSFLPKTTVQLSPQGDVKKSDAPNLDPGVRLPGLDVKRFPDITYVPVVFPEGEIKPGDTWKFDKKFGTSAMSYECLLKAANDKTAAITIKVAQDYTVLEDESLKIVEEKDAVNSVATHVTGTGTLVFDQKLKVFRTVLMKAHSESVVTDIKAKTTTKRVLDSEFKCTLKSPKWDGATKQVVQKAWWEQAWDTTVSVSSDLYARSKGYALYAKEAYTMMMRLLFGGKA